MLHEEANLGLRLGVVRGRGEWKPTIRKSVWVGLAGRVEDSVGRDRTGGSMTTEDVELRGLAEKDRRYVWHPMARLSQPGAPMMVERGEGAWITDTEGNRYLDGMAGLWYV